MHKYAHFGHVLHFSRVTYGRHRVQRVKIGGLQPELAFHQIVSQTLLFIEDFPLLLGHVPWTYLGGRIPVGRQNTPYSQVTVPFHACGVFESTCIGLDGYVCVY